MMKLVVGHNFPFDIGLLAVKFTLSVTEGILYIYAKVSICLLGGGGGGLITAMVPLRKRAGTVPKYMSLYVPGFLTQIGKGSCEWILSDTDLFDNPSNQEVRNSGPTCIGLIPGLFTVIPNLTR
jgi:hypothetical protein